MLMELGFFLTGVVVGIGLTLLGFVAAMYNGWG